MEIYVSMTEILILLSVLICGCIGMVAYGKKTGDRQIVETGKSVLMNIVSFILQFVKFNIKKK